MLLDVLQKYWGYSEFRTLQEEAMSCVFDARDSVVVLPTGGGKSLCYQAPAMCREGVAVVVSPLISLMKDQVDSLKTCGISAAFINSTQSVAEKRQVADDFRNGTLRLLYIAPERLVQPQTIEFLQQQTISFIAVDEAHCISEWGHDFRPEFRELARLRDSFPDISIHASPRRRPNRYGRTLPNNWRCAIRRSLSVRSTARISSTDPSGVTASSIRRERFSTGTKTNQGSSIARPAARSIRSRPSSTPTVIARCPTTPV